VANEVKSVNPCSILRATNGVEWRGQGALATKSMTQRFFLKVHSVLKKQQQWPDGTEQVPIRSVGFCSVE